MTRNAAAASSYASFSASHSRGGWGGGAGLHPSVKPPPHPAAAHTTGGTGGMSVCVCKCENMCRNKPDFFVMCLCMNSMAVDVLSNTIALREREMRLCV